MSGSLQGNAGTHRRRRVGRGLGWLMGIVLVVAMPASALADASDKTNQEARQWLDRIASAAQELNYHGTFVYRRDDQLTVMRITHVADSEGERERLVSLNGQPREIFRDSDGVICILPDRRLVFEGKRGAGRHFPVQHLQELDKLSEYYHFSLGNSGRIAKREARLIIVEPSDRYRYGYRIWVDEATGLLLKSDLINDEGKAIEQLMFTNLEVVDKPSPEMLDAVAYDKRPRKEVKTTRISSPQQADKDWDVSEAPRGFWLMEHYQHQGSEGKGPLEHMVFTDGLASVSVFIERLGNAEPHLQGVSQRGAVNAYGTVIDEHQLTVVGEVPSATVELIGQAIRQGRNAND